MLEHFRGTSDIATSAETRNAKCPLNAAEACPVGDDIGHPRGLARLEGIALSANRRFMDLFAIYVPV